MVRLFCNNPPQRVGTDLVPIYAFGVLLILCVKRLNGCRWMCSRDFKFNSAIKAWCLLLISLWAGKFKPEWCCNHKLVMLQKVSQVLSS